MRRVVVRTTGIIAFLAAALACGGGEGTDLAGDLVGPKASAQAQALCEHLSQEHQAPCVPVAVGETQSIGGFEVQVSGSQRFEGVATLPQVKNGVERNTVKRVDGSMLAVNWTVRNDTPVKAQAPFGIYMIDGGGNQTDAVYFNTRIYADGVGRSSVFEEALGPQQQVEGATVFPVKEPDLQRSLMILEMSERRPDPEDPRGRMKTFVTEQVVLDLNVPPATP